MRENKIAFWLTSVLATISLVVAYFLDKHMITFWANVFLGVFGSSLLAAITAIIFYQAARRRTLEAFYKSCNKAKQNFLRFTDEGTYEETMELVLLMDEFDYQPIDDAYGDIDFLFGNRMRDKIFNEIYLPIHNFRIEISHYAERTREYKKLVKHNIACVRPVPFEILSNVFLKKTEWKEVDCSNIGPITYSSVENNAVNAIEPKLNGFFYVVMYPYRKIIDLIE